jgi:hypothetical protein
VIDVMTSRPFRFLINLAQHRARQTIGGIYDTPGTLGAP